MKKLLISFLCFLFVSSNAFAYLQSDSLKIKDDEGEIVTIDGSFAANRTVTIPDASFTMVGEDTTQTLTNKTLTAANNVIGADTAEAMSGSGQIDDDDLAAGAVDGGVGGEIADDSITADDLAANSVGESELSESMNFVATGAWDYGGATLEIPNSITLPATCTVGQVYMDTDATSGQRIYACESTNTWALQGDGGGGGGGDNITVNSTTATDANFLDGDIDWTINTASTPDDITATVACTGCIDSTDLADTISIPTGLTIPQGTAPTADDPGEIAHDTTDNQLIMDDYVIPHKRQIHIPVGSPTAGTYLLGRAKDGMTILSIDCIVDPADTGENTVIQLQECDGTGDNCADVDAGTDITCDNDGAADDGTLSNPSIDAGDWYALEIVSVSGTVTQANVTVDYTTVRE